MRCGGARAENGQPKSGAPGASNAGGKTDVLVNMEKFSASGYYMEPDNCPDGGSGISLDVAPAKGREKASPNGRKSVGHSPKGLGRSPKSPARLKQKGRSKSGSRTEEPASPPPVTRGERTRRLLIAALRVWELKQGLR